MLYLITTAFTILTGDTEKLTSWIPKGLSKESIRLPASPGKNLAPKLKWIYVSKITGEFNGSFLKQNKGTFTHRNVVNLFVVYKLDT